MPSTWKLLLCTHFLTVCLSGLLVPIQANTVRSFLFTVCHGRQVISDITSDVTVTSRRNCLRQCTSHPECRSCSCCTTGGSTTCNLSTQQPSSCPAVTILNSQCSAQLMVNVLKCFGRLLCAVVYSLDKWLTFLNLSYWTCFLFLIVFWSSVRCSCTLIFHQPWCNPLWLTGLKAPTN